MLITVIGKSYAAKKLSLELAKNKDNIVFITTECEGVNAADINPYDINEIKDFIIANEIGLCVVADEEYVNSPYEALLNETECVVLHPGEAFAKMSTNLSSSKKFAYKNKILTGKFAVFERFIQAEEYILKAEFPLVIMPDVKNKTQAPFIAETKDKALKRAETLFQTGNKRILIENYIPGVEYTQFLISDGIITLELFDAVSRFEEICTNNTNYISKAAKDKIRKSIIPAIMDSFMEEGLELQGILGVDFIIRGDEVYFSRFRPFLSDCDVDIALNTIDEDLEKLLYSAAAGTLGENFSRVKTNSKYALSVDTDGEIISAAANTMTKVCELAEIEGADKKIIEEGLKFWAR